MEQLTRQELIVSQFGGWKCKTHGQGRATPSVVGKDRFHAHLLTAAGWPAFCDVLWLMGA